jgi:hypothetical protein
MFQTVGYFFGIGAAESRNPKIAFPLRAKTRSPAYDNVEIVQHTIEHFNWWARRRLHPDVRRVDPSADNRPARRSVPRIAAFQDSA